MTRSTVSLVSLWAVLFITLAVPAAVAIDGPLANASVSFGLWQTDPPLDRFPDLSPRLRNEHQVIPREVEIQAGGGVNFIVSGFHQLIVYDRETQPGDIDVENVVPSTGTPAGVPLINDPANRIYRGLDPSRQPPLTSSGPVTQDRIEVVHFPKPGTYLVICGVQSHFVDDRMLGFVRVRSWRNEIDDGDRR